MAEISRARRQRTGADHLPAELIDMIVALLCHDTESLKTCCRLSRQWLSLARPRLFRRARIRCEGDFERILELTKSFPAVASEYLQVLDVMPRGQIESGYFPDMPPMPMVKEMFWRLRLRNVTDDLRTFVRCFPSVEDITVCGTFYCNDTLRRFLSLFHSLKVIRLERLNSERRFRLPADVAFDFSRLEKLVVGKKKSMVYDWLVTWMLTRTSTPNIRILNLECDGLKDAYKTEFLKWLSPSLEELTLGLTDANDVADTPPVMSSLYDFPWRPDIPRLQSLRKMTFEYINKTDNDYKDGFPTFDWVAGLIENTQAGKMDRVSTVQYSFYTDWNEEALDELSYTFDWNRAVNIAKNAFPRMQTLVVRVRTGFYVHTEDSDKMEELLRTTLAEFCDDGLRLLFEWYDIRMPQGYIPIVPPEMTLEREWHCSDLF